MAGEKQHRPLGKGHHRPIDLCLLIFRIPFCHLSVKAEPFILCLWDSFLANPARNDAVFCATRNAFVLSRVKQNVYNEGDCKFNVSFEERNGFFKFPN
jgi:hypothetical protein